MTKFFKVQIDGAENSGKTSLILRYMDASFTNKRVRLGTDYKYRTLTIMDEEIKLLVWDQMPRNILIDNPYRGFHAILVVFDLTDKDSFKLAKKKCEHHKVRGPDNMPIVLVGTKSDEEQKVQQDKIKKFASENKIPYQATSSKDNMGIDELFNDLVNRLMAPVSLERVNNEKRRSLWRQTPKYQRESNGFETIWNQEKYVTQEEKIIALLEDYTKRNSIFGRFFTGHWNRNHVFEVNSICVRNDYSKRAGKQLTAQQLIDEISIIPMINDQGTLATLVEFLKDKRGEPSRNSSLRLELSA